MTGEDTAAERCIICGGERHDAIACAGGLIAVEGSSREDALPGAPANERHGRRAGNDTLEISTVNDLRWVDGVTAQIAEFCAEHRLAPGIAFALNLAVYQLLSGTIAYGYDDDGSHGIEIIARLEGHWLVVAIVDDARAYDAWAVPKPGHAARLEAMSAGTSRLFFARKVVEDVRYRRTNGCNVVTLMKFARPWEEP